MRRRLVTLVALVVSCVIAFGVYTKMQLRPFPDALPPEGLGSLAPRYVDRNGEPLSVTYRNTWNVHDVVPLYDIPDFLKLAFIAAEDQRFYSHGGADWIARLHAAFQNVRALRAVRGASTISEQSVRMLHPRRRTVWARWLEGFEAARLEARFSKDDVFEFYLNQVPYARNRRGVAQAAREYFDRDLQTLNEKEMLALAVLVRSPSRFDLHRGTTLVEKRLAQVAERMVESSAISEDERQRIVDAPLSVRRSQLPVDAAHFVGYLHRANGQSPVRRTTLDSSLQRRAQQILDKTLEGLRGRDVTDGAVLAIDHETDEVLVWVNAGGFDDDDGGQIDMVTTPRQPGSTLKPFLYALALENGWTAATLVDDSPLMEAVGNGLHPFQNYSRHYYGQVRVREALGNSLNVPAIRAIRYTGRSEFLSRLQRLGVVSLEQHPDFYGDGLALGNGELSLLELVNAYATLARGGVYRPLRLGTEDGREAGRQVFSAEVSSIVANVLSDPEARALEFGRASVLELPVQTAVKTGTSNDYRDAWIVGFSHRYAVGVWMGNLDRKPMRGVTGSSGPGLVLRALFAELHRNRRSRSLPLSRRLRQVEICRESGARPLPACPRMTEWFRARNVPAEPCSRHGDVETTVTVAHDLRVIQPSPGLHLAMDPRIPDEIERFELRLARSPEGACVSWFVDDELVDVTTREHGSLLWPVARGSHVARARVDLGDEEVWTEKIAFHVK